MKLSGFGSPLVLFLLLMMAMAGCDNGTGGGGGGSGNEEDTGGGGGGGDKANTSGYDGLLTWTKGLQFGVFLWDLPASKMSFQDYNADDLFAMRTAPTISADRSTLAYTQNESVGLGGMMATTIVRDLVNNEEFIYPNDGIAANQQRLSYTPSLSADGQIVAVSEKRFDWVDTEFGRMPENETAQNIQVWNRKTGTLIDVTSGNSSDYLPRLSADGSRVLFVSDRDEKKGDFYLADVQAGAAVTRVSFRANAAIQDIDYIGRPGTFSVSADLRWVAFVAFAKIRNDQNEWNYFLLDTTTGSVEHLDVQPHGFALSKDGLSTHRTISISRDASTLAYNFNFADIGATPIRMGHQVHVAQRTSPTQTRLIVASDDVVLSTAVALSSDGSQLAYSLGNDALWVSKSDGKDPRQVVFKSQKLVGGNDFYLSF